MGALTSSLAIAKRRRRKEIHNWDGVPVIKSLGITSESSFSDGDGPARSCVVTKLVCRQGQKLHLQLLTRIVQVFAEP